MNTVIMVAGPVIGSLIGYVTNYIAVKMLFRPLRPIKIGKFRIPFTPGIFPKRKEQLAQALGKAVGNNLLTSKDVENLFLSENMKQKVVGQIGNSLFAEDERHTVQKLLSGYFQEDGYQTIKEQLENMLCAKIIAGLSQVDLASIIVQESARAIREKARNTLLAMMVNDKLIAALTTPVGEKVETYIRDNAPQSIRTIVRAEIETFEEQPLGTLVRKIGLQEESFLEMAEKVYVEFIQNKISGFIQQFDIAGTVEQKVNAMDVLEIEKLVFSVMKHELNAIVNLGALIGFVIGLLNIFVLYLQ